MRNTSAHFTSAPSAQSAPLPVIFHTRPWPVVPSPVQRFPFLSKAMPFVPGTWTANASLIDAGLVYDPLLLRVSFQMTPPFCESAAYRFLALSKVIPEGPQVAAAGFDAFVGFGMLPIWVNDADSVPGVICIFQTGHGLGSVGLGLVATLLLCANARPVV
jgi:hypothetical protein